MKAIVQREFGEPKVLVLEEVERPVPGPGQVLVKVGAAGVHVLDTNIRRGQAPPPMLPARFPTTPGREIAGTVEAVGADVEDSLVGSRVVVHVGFLNGGYAQYALAPAASLHTLPAQTGFAEAVAAIGTGRTAQLVLDTAPVGPADTVIVTGASGGLGSQLAHLSLAAGARVIALYGGASKREAVAGIASRDGARPVLLDTEDPAWPERLGEELPEGGATLAFDGVGGPVARVCLEALGRGGHHVIYGWSSGTLVEAAAQDIADRALTVSSVLGRPIAELRALELRALDAVARGDVTPLVTAFPLAEAAAAHTAIETRASRGKVVLLP